MHAAQPVDRVKYYLKKPPFYYTSNIVSLYDGHYWHLMCLYFNFVDGQQERDNENSPCLTAVVKNM